MKGETTMAKQPTRSASMWRNTVIAVVTLIAGFTASAAQAALIPVYRFYHLDAQCLVEVDAWLRPFEHYWNQRLQALADVLDEESKT